jgi:alpha-L-arabinofuranosidase
VKGRSLKRPWASLNVQFGDSAWEDYELTLQACQERGAEGFLVLFRAEDDDSFYWLNLGDWGNTRHAITNTASD